MAENAESFINSPSLDVLIIDGPAASQGGTDTSEVTPEVTPPGLRHVGHTPAVALRKILKYLQSWQSFLTFLLD